MAKIAEIVVEDSPEGRRICIQGACDDVLASVEDRRANGGAVEVIRTKTLSLIELLFADLEP